jgi:inner membrane transporter RhtA
MDTGKAVTIGMIFASLLVLPIALGDGLLIRLRPAMLVPGIALALLSSAIPFTLEMHALRKIPAKMFSILMSLEPAVAALTGLLFLGEYLSLYEWLAVTFIILASAGASLTAKKSTAAVIEN